MHKRKCVIIIQCCTSHETVMVLELPPTGDLGSKCHQVQATPVMCQAVDTQKSSQLYIQNYFKNIMCLFFTLQWGKSSNRIQIILTCMKVKFLQLFNENDF